MFFYRLIIFNIADKTFQFELNYKLDLMTISLIKGNK